MRLRGIEGLASFWAKGCRCPNKGRESNTGRLQLPLSSEISILWLRGHMWPTDFENTAFVLFFRIEIRRLLSCFYFSNMSIFSMTVFYSI